MTSRTKIEELLAESSWLSRLAQALVDGDEDADDLVQETWMAVLKNPANAKKSSRGLLRRVMRHRLIDRRRSDSARRKREVELAKPGFLPSEKANAERVAMHRRLVAEIERLPEPSRSTVVFRYFDGLTPTEIAQAQGIPASTVRNRLRRTLTQLRQRLDESAGGRSSWALVVGPLFRTRPTPVGMIFAGSLIGAAIMPSLLKIFVAMGAIAMVCFLALNDETEDRLQSAKSPEERTREIVLPRRSVDPKPLRHESPDAHRLLPTAPRASLDSQRSLQKKSCTFALEVKLGDGETPGVVPVIVTPILGLTASGTGKPIDAETDDQGRLTLDLLPILRIEPVEIRVDVDLAGYFPVRAQFHINELRIDPKTGEKRLQGSVELAQSKDVGGRVLGPDGSPSVFATVGCFAKGPQGTWDERPLDTATTDESGNYVIGASPQRPCFVVAVAQGLLGGGVEIDGMVLEVPAIQLDDGVTIAGRAILNGLPQEGVDVEAVLKGQAMATRLYLANQSYMVLGHEIVTETQTGKTDGEGRFQILGLKTGEYQVAITGIASGSVHMSASRGTRVGVRAPATGLELALNGSIVAVQVAIDGKPAQVGVRYINDGFHYCSTDKRGRVEMLMKAGSPCQVEVSQPGYVPFRTSFTPSPGIPREIVVNLKKEVPKPSLRATLAGPKGLKVKKVSFDFYATNSGGIFPLWSRPAFVKNGVAVASRLRNGRWWLVCRPGGRFGGHDYATTMSTWVTIPFEGEVDLDLQWDLGGRLRLSAKNSDGQFLAPKCKIFAENGSEIPVSFFVRYGSGAGSLGEGGLFKGDNEVDPALAPGLYRIELTLGSRRKKSFQAVIKAGETTTLKLTL